MSTISDNELDRALSAAESTPEAQALNAAARHLSARPAFVSQLESDLRLATSAQPAPAGLFASLRRWLAGALFQPNGGRPAWAFSALTFAVILISVTIFGALVFGGKPPRSVLIGSVADYQPPQQESTSEPTATLASTATQEAAVTLTATRPSYHQMCPVFDHIPAAHPSLTPAAVTPDPAMPTIPPGAHIVAEDEDLCTILFRYWLNTEDYYVELILELNDMESVTDVEVGQSLMIPMPPPNRWEPHPGVPSTPCLGFLYVSAWLPGTAYGLDDAGNQIPCDMDAPAPTLVVLDVSQTSAQAGFAVQQFTAPIPAGYTMTNHQVYVFDDETHVGTKYSGSGDAWFSLNQTSPMSTEEDLTIFVYGHYAGEFTSEPVTVNGNAGVFVPIQSNNVGGSSEHALVWNEDGFTFLMWATDLTKEEMLALAASVQ